MGDVLRARPAWIDSLESPDWSSAESPSSDAFSAIAVTPKSLRHSHQADRRVRPLRRRAEMMARPARVRIRRRKPWVRLRRRLLGWNVRLLMGRLPPSSGCSTIRYVLTRHASQEERAGGSGRCRRPSNGTGDCQTGQTGPNLGGLRNSGRRCPVDTPNVLANIPDSLARRGGDC
jgi:hypothetical protein